MKVTKQTIDLESESEKYKQQVKTLEANVASEKRAREKLESECKKVNDDLVTERGTVFLVKIIFI